MKYKKKPLTAGVMALIASIGCIAVGFSSWSASLGTGDETIIGFIETDSIETGTYFSATIITAEINSHGFIVNDEVRPTGKFQLKYTIINYNSLIGNYSTMNFDYSLSYGSSLGEHDLFDEAVCVSALDSSSSHSISDYHYSFADSHIAIDGSFSVSIPTSYSPIVSMINFAFNNLPFDEAFANSLSTLEFSLSTEVSLN